MRYPVRTSTSKRRLATAGVCGLLLLMFLALPCPAVELAPIAWHSDVAQAWQKSQVQQRPLIVYVTRDNCVFCEKMKHETWRDARVAQAVSEGFVPLFVDGTQPSALTKELAVSAYPATFVISPQAVVLERINGYVPPERLAARLSSMRSAAGARVAGRP